ncbi:MAG TPA: PAS domain S-box protein [Sphingobacteriaceae bacterium]
MRVFLKRALLFIPLYLALGLFPVLLGAGTDLHATFFSKGVSLAFVILFGPVMGILVFGCQLLVALITGVSLPDSLILAGVAATFTVLQGLALNKLKNAAVFQDHKALVALLCLIIFVFQPVAVASAQLLGYNPDGDLFHLLEGWLAYGNGQVVITPLLLVSYAWYTSGKSRSGLVETLSWTLAAGILTALLYYWAGFVPSGYKHLTFGLLIPFFILLSLRKDQLTVCAALFSSSLASYLVAEILPLSGQHQLFNDHAQLHLFMISMSVSALLIVSFSQNERRLKEVLQEGEAQYRMLFEHMAHAFVYGRVTQDGPGGPIDFRILMTNNQYAGLVGIARDELPGRNLAELFPSAVEEYLEKYLQVATTGTPYHSEFYSQVINRHISVTAYRPKPDHVAVVMEDVTDRINAEIILKKREQEFSSAFHGSNIGVSLVDLEGNFMLVNDELCTITGYSKAELEGMNGNRITHPADVGISTEFLRNALAYHGVERSRFEKRYIHKSGKMVHCNVSLSLMRSDDGEPMYFIAHIKDVSIRKAQEEQIKRDNEKLSRLNGIKNRFFSIIGHDLRSPISAIKMLSEIIRTDLEENKPDEARKRLDMLADQSDKTYKLLTDLLAWARVQQTDTAFLFEETDLNALIASEVESLKGQADNKRISLRFSPGRLVTIAMDPNMIRTVIRNLVANAIKYSFEGGQVVIAASERYDEVLISVGDSGKGMADHTLAGLFTPGYKVSVPGTARETGTGFGLALCKEFVELHHGTIWAESREGKGSTFYFTIPHVYADETSGRPQSKGEEGAPHKKEGL